jgi:nitrite reductase/ring-hydroxylating ferredoxin subunit
MDGERIASVEDVPENGSYLFTVEEPSGREEEIILVALADGIAAWKNFCMHEPDQRLDRGLGNGVAMRDDQLICPKHGSMFDAETGYCDNGEARGQSLVSVEVTVADGEVYLTDDSLSYLHEGGIDDDSMPGSSSHLQF